jgi:1,4-dihydroxy-6-naphthoate synthase
MSNQKHHVRVGHSPDPDDAFMFYGIAAGKVDTAGFEIEQVLEDIETLNRRALVGELEVSVPGIAILLAGSCASVNPGLATIQGP